MTWRGLLLTILGVLFAASLILSGLALSDRFNQSDRNRQQNARAWHLVLCLAEKELGRSDATPAQKERVRAFYDHALKLVHAAPCEQSRAG